MTLAGAGRDGQGTVLHRGDGFGADHRLARAEIQKCLLLPIVREAMVVGIICHAGIVGGKDLIDVGPAAIYDAEVGIGLPTGLLIVLFQRHEHDAVSHPVPVDNGMKTAEVTAAPVIHKNRAYRAGGLFPAMVQIISIVTFCTRG